MTPLKAFRDEQATRSERWTRSARDTWGAESCEQNPHHAKPAVCRGDIQNGLCGEDSEVNGCNGEVSSPSTTKCGAVMCYLCPIT